MALNGVATSTPSTPFFRFPFFDSTPATLDLLQSRGIVVFGADLWASDWNPMPPQQTLKLLTARLSQARKGIILLHDPKAQTSAMLPAFLRFGSWIGGDRDGNPYVTPALTREALERARQLILDFYLEQINRLYPRLSASSRQAPVSRALLEVLERYGRMLPGTAIEKAR